MTNRVGRTRHVTAAAGGAFRRTSHSGVFLPLDGGEPRQGMDPGALVPGQNGVPWGDARDGEQVQAPDIGPGAVDGETHILPASLTRPLFAETIIPPEVVTSLPSLPDEVYPVGSLVFLTTDAKLYRNTDGESWSRAVDGADIMADSVVAGSIAVGAIGADELAVGAVTAEHLAAVIVLASLFKTAETGRRVEIDTQGVRLLGSSEELLVNIPTNGDPVYIRGEIIADSLVSESAAEIRGTMDLRTGSVVTAESAVGNPVTSPIVTVSLESLQLGTSPPGPGYGLYRDAAAGTYWVGADPTISNYVAHEYNATTGALVRSINKTGSVTTYTTTLGSGSHISDSAEATQGTGDSQIATPLTMPSNGYPKRITKVSGYLAGYTGNQTCKMAVWHGDASLLGVSAAFTALQRTFTNGNSVQYERSLTSPVSVSDGQTIYAGWLRTTGSPGFWWDKDNGSFLTDKGDGLEGPLTGLSFDTSAKPNVYITYEYDVDTLVEQAKIVGVASDGSSVVAALGADGILHRYNRTNLSYLGATDLSSHILGAEANAGLTFDGTNFVVTTATGSGSSVQVRFVKVNTSGVHQSNQATTGFTINGTTAKIRGGYYDGTTYIWVLVDGQARKYSYGSGAYVSNQEFGSSSSSQDGLAYDGSVFRGWSVSTPTKIWKFTSWDWTTESGTYWIGFSWYDSAGTTHETLVGPRTSIAMRRRERLQITTPSIPIGGADDPDNCRVYFVRGSSDPGAGNFKLQVTDALTSRFIATYNSGGAADPTSNNFQTGGAAEMRSALATSSGGWSVKGDGTVTFGGGLRLGGTSFPSTPATNDVFYRTDRDILYFYDGTRWLSVTQYQVPIPVSRTTNPLTVTFSAHESFIPNTQYDVWIEEFIASFVVSGGTALSGSHKWVLTLERHGSATTISTINIDSGASDSRRRIVAAVNALTGTSDTSFTITSTKTGTPGSLYLWPGIRYRVVG